MEKKVTATYKQRFEKIWICFVLQIFFFLIGVLLLSGLIYQEVIPISWDMIVVFVLAGTTAFCTTAASSAFSKNDLFAKSLFTQVFFWCLLLFAGMVLRSTPAPWLLFFTTLGIVVVATIISALLFGGKKKKKFQKNVTTRLKKR